MKKNIFVFTCSRSDFGILSELCDALEKHRMINLSLIVCGSHLDKKFGYTFNEIKRKKYQKIYKIKNLKIKNNSIDIPLSSIKLNKHFFKIIKKNKPDALIVLGDRFEILIACQVAYLMNIPIFHLHGGEVTSGSLDDAIRHSVSKLSNLHFVSTIKSKKRLILMGENSENIQTVGAISYEKLRKLKNVSTEKLENKLGFKFLKHNLILSYHPELCSSSEQKKKLGILLNALNQFKDCRIILTSPGADRNHYVVNECLKKFAKKNKDSVYIKSMGFELFNQTLSKIDCIIGNSSSGIIEAPFHKVWTINVGNRQDGREKSNSIICSDYDLQEIKKKILYTFQHKIKNLTNPYLFKKSPSSQIIKKIIQIDFKKKLNKTSNFIL